MISPQENQSMQRTMIDTLVAYHAALHQQLWASVMHLTDAQFVDSVGYAHGSIRNQLVHLAVIETRWLRGLQGDPNARAFALNPEDYPTRAACQELWEAITRALPAYVASLSEADLLASGPGMGEPVWQVLVHLVIHGVDHRAQVLRLLHDQDAPTFPQDFIIYLWNQPPAP
jgi:uncharacterized damage-inducible protein DinB